MLNIYKGNDIPNAMKVEYIQESPYLQHLLGYDEYKSNFLIYRIRENLRYCSEYGIELSRLKLRRPFKGSQKNRELLRERRQIEREDESTKAAYAGILNHKPKQEDKKAELSALQFRHIWFF